MYLSEMAGNAPSIADVGNEANGAALRSKFARVTNSRQRFGFSNIRNAMLSGVREVQGKYWSKGLETLLLGALSRNRNASETNFIF